MRAPRVQVTAGDTQHAAALASITTWTRNTRRFGLRAHRGTAVPKRDAMVQRPASTGRRRVDEILTGAWPREPAAAPITPFQRGPPVGPPRPLNWTVLPPAAPRRILPWAARPRGFRGKWPGSLTGLLHKSA